jgi:hypothetical protein
MMVAIHQPQYLPWLPYCDKAACADVFVFLDNVQYQKNGVQNRNQIKTAAGALWLTVPVNASVKTTVAQTPLADTHWPVKHLKTLRQNYSRAAHGELLDELETLLMESWPTLAELNIAITEWMFRHLAMDTQCVRASCLDVNGEKEELVIDICREVGAKHYVSGQGARAYQNAERFAAVGVELLYHHYEHPEYPQCYPKLGFLPHLSALDLLLNTGAKAGEYLRIGRREFEAAT